jgi:hypothetical protein
MPLPQKLMNAGVERDIDRRMNRVAKDLIDVLKVTLGPRDLRLTHYRCLTDSYHLFFRKVGAAV